MDFIILFVPQPTQVTDSPHCDQEFRRNKLSGMLFGIFDVDPKMVN